MKDGRDVEVQDERDDSTDERHESANDIAKDVANERKDEAEQCRHGDSDSHEELEER